MNSTQSDPRATVSAMWRTRPTRRQGDRKLAGVAGALARRYDVDPVLVRIGFVVAALFGIGVLLYLAAWAVLEPDPGDPPTGPLISGTVVRVLLYIALVLATVQAIHSLATGDLDVLIGLAVVAGLLYLLQVSRGDRGPGPGSPGAADPGTGTAAAATSTALPPPPTPRKPRSRVTAATIGAMLLTAGILGAAMLAVDPGPTGPRLLIGALLAVLGVGLLVGSFRRGGRGLILLAVPLLLVGYGSTRWTEPTWEGAGELRVAPTSVATLSPAYERSLGRVELDLRRLDLTTPPGAGAAGERAPAPTPPATGTPATPGPPPTPAAPGPATASGPSDTPGTAAPGIPPIPGTPPAADPAVTPVGPGEPVRTRVRVQTGEAVVIVPADADVRVHCHADAGDVDCLGVDGRPGVGAEDGSDGPSADARVDNLGADAAPGGRVLELDVSVGVGQVEVRRAGNG